MAWVGKSDEAIAADIERVWRDEVPVARENGGDRRSAEALEQPGGTRVNLDGGYTADSILARLKRDNPDLAQQVIRGELSANAAARIMG